MRLHYTKLSAALQSARTMCLSAALVHLENTADDFRVGGGGEGEGAGGGRVCRKVQSYAFQMNLIVESSHVLTVTCINGLMEGSVGTPRGDQCQGLECRSHRSFLELKIFTLTVTQDAVANNTVTYPLLVVLVLLFLSNLLLDFPDTIICNHKINQAVKKHPFLNQLFC